MLRSPLGRKLAARAHAARRFALVLGLFLCAASVPYINAGASQQEANRERMSAVAPKGQANIVEGAEFVPGEVLVRFRSDAAAKSAEAAPMSLRQAEDDGDVTFQRFAGSDIVLGLRLASVDPARTLEAVAEIASRPDVLYAEPNYIWRAKRTPNDPRYVNGEMYALNRISAPVAWNTTVGNRNVVVGVLDGGVDINHEDLRDNIWTNPGEVPNNNFDDDGNGLIDDVNGWDFHHNDKTIFDGEDGDDHATHVAGTIGAEGDNNIGVSGVNWQVSIMSLKVLGPDGGSTASIIKGYNYARQMLQRGVNIRVLNNSYGGPGNSLSALDAIRQLNTAGILFVVAAGNGGSDGSGDDNFTFREYPASYDVPNVLAVAATDSGDNIADFSNFSSRIVSMGAPGRSILSTVPPSMAGVLGFPAGTAYAFYGGTSMASPQVAGAAALVLAARPDIALPHLRGVLAYSGDRIPALSNNTTTGRRLNVANAMASALENDGGSPGFMFDFRVVGQTSRTVTLSWSAPPEDLNTGSGTCSDYDFYFRDSSGNFGILLPTTVQPAAPGTQQTVTLNIPYRHFDGSVEIRAYDNVGNANGASTNVTIPVDVNSDPYTVALSAAQPLTTGTTSNLFPSGGDDKYAPYNLPFSFPFFGVHQTTLTVSSNGTLYFSTPPRRPGNDADDAGSASEALQGQKMIAGLWDDIDLNRVSRPDSGVYVTPLDANRIVFRWQGIPCNPTAASQGACTGGSPVNFEIELRSDGTIQMRYGQNPNLFPVVGISNGEPDAYLVTSHTSETQPKNLTNAQTVTFVPRGVPVFSISGSVKDANGAGVPDITMFLSGGQSALAATSGSSGNYSFNGLPANLNYTVTPSHPNYNFTPASINIASLTSNQGANFIASLKNPAGPNSIGFAQTGYEFSEGDGRATFTVIRSGDTTGTATVDYRTTDSDTFTIGCANTVNNQGGAFARCDFATTVGKLSFVAGEAIKNITVPIIDDGHDENAETFQLRLSNASGTGTTLGAQSVATVTIQDNDTGVTPNPVVNSVPFFVRQHYLDFLSREPEANEPWSAVLARCADINTGHATNTDCDRIAVSRAFFESPEFNLKGSYAFRFYKLAFNRLPQYTEIVSDMSFLAGATPAEVFARRAELASAFTQRQEFVNAYGTVANAPFVTALMGRYGLSSITTPDPFTPDSGTRVTLSGNELINRLDSNLLTRGQVLRAIADSDQVQAMEFNNAFIAVQYYGYLRRTPDDAGYQANLNALLRGTSRREMVHAFLNSTEYRLRFGQP
jgi:subtilisin family serine protease